MWKMTYSEGYREALVMANQSTISDLFDWLDGLQGTDSLSIRASDYDIRQKLKRQIREDFLIPAHNAFSSYVG